MAVRLPPEVRDRIIVRAALDRYVAALVDEVEGIRLGGQVELFHDAEKRLRHARAARVRFVQAAELADRALLNEVTGINQEEGGTR